MTSSRLVDYSKFKADVNLDGQLEALQEESTMSSSSRRRSSATVEQPRRRSSATVEHARRRRSSAEFSTPSAQSGDHHDEIKPTLDSSMGGIGEIFDDDSSNEDHEEGDVVEERDLSNSHESYTNNASAQSLHASAASLTSKRRTQRRRSRPKGSIMDDQSMSHSMLGHSAPDHGMSNSMPDFDSRYRYNYERKTPLNKIKAGNHGSLSDFLERKGRQKTSLLPGSTTEDLCSDMKLASARALQGSRSRLGKKTPSRASTAPALIHRANTSDAMNSSLQAGHTSRLRDYSQRSHASDQDRSQQDQHQNQPYIPTNPRRDSKILQQAPENLTQSISPSMATRRQRRATMAGGGVHAPTNTRRSKSPTRSSVSPSRDRRTPQRSKSHTESPHSEITTRRLPPKSKSTEGTNSKRPVRRTPTDPDKAMTSAFPMGNSSFVTGSRIRRITPGGGGHSSLESSLSRLNCDRSTRSRSQSGSPTRKQGRRSSKLDGSK